MIGLDTNVVVRLLVEDHPAQLERSREVLAPIWEQGKRAFVSDIVLAELEWVLDSAYSVPRTEILSTLHALAADPRFAFQDRPRFLQALRLYQEGSGDLSDYLVGLIGQDQQVVTTLTFDRALRKTNLFRVL